MYRNFRKGCLLIACNTRLFFTCSGTSQGNPCRRGVASTTMPSWCAYSTSSAPSCSSSLLPSMLPIVQLTPLGS
ncbi:hypothetical protein PR003_g11917 [Phytophthora rubi]|uniref:Secreted protein n=1 Tax=Phytophthora rubi TaxID=129364 RepID=A0A6A3M1L9_9STRA|nr:hypothetical protein PR002_g11509 [Phytophthora rubi]KAE9337608.1 hypothetical protein PR003_g11917 [Phytophthora rubi]